MSLIANFNSAILVSECAYKNICTYICHTSIILNKLSIKLECTQCILKFLKYY